LSESSYKVIIVGAGVSGLACARELEARGITPLILEKSDRVGGRIQSDEVDGFILDRGFQVFLEGYEKTSELTGPLQYGHFKSGALIWDGEKLHRLFDPRRHPTEIFAALRSGTFSIKDLILLFKLWRRRLPEFEGSTLEFLTQYGFSERAIRRFFKPFFSGVFLDHSLETDYRFFIFAFEQFCRGRALLPKGGMNAIPEAIAAGLKRSGLSLESEVLRVEPTEVVLENKKRLGAEYIVMATDLSTTSSFLDFKELDHSRKVFTFYFAAKVSPLKENVILLNACESPLFNSLSVLTDVEASYSTNGEALISISTLEEISEADLLKEMELIFGSKVQEWRFIRRYLIENALPLMNTFNTELLNEVEVSICGDFIGVPSIENAVISGLELAKTIATELNS